MKRTLTVVFSLLFALVVTISAGVVLTVSSDADYNSTSGANYKITTEVYYYDCNSYATINYSGGGSSGEVQIARANNGKETESYEFYSSSFPTSISFRSDRGSGVYNLKVYITGPSGLTETLLDYHVYWVAWVNDSKAFSDTRSISGIVTDKTGTQYLKSGQTTTVRYLPYDQFGVPYGSVSSLGGSTTGVTLSGNTATITASNMSSNPTTFYATAGGKNSASVTFIRQYLLNPVSSNASWGSVSRSTDAAAYNTSVTATANPYDDYYFEGWYDGYTKLSSNSSYTFNMPAADYSITAKFEPKYVVSFNANGGTGNGSVIKYAPGQSIYMASALAAGTRTGYSFEGWAAYSTATEGQYAAGSIQVFSTDKTFYAAWKLIPAVKPTISAATGLSVTYGGFTGKSISVTVPAINGHTLSYQWYKCDAEGADGIPVSGATGINCPIADNTPAGTYYYYCDVKATRSDNSLYDTTRSSVVTVSVAKAGINPSVSVSGWNVGQSAASPSVGGNPGGGSVIYTYYTNSALSIKTGAANGASAAGGVPSEYGSYWLKAEVAGTANYLAGSASCGFNIGIRIPDSTKITGTTPVTIDNKNYDQLIYLGSENMPQFSVAYTGNYDLTGFRLVSSDESIISIDNSNRLTTYATGTVTITCYSAVYDYMIAHNIAVSGTDYAKLTNTITILVASDPNDTSLNVPSYYKNVTGYMGTSLFVNWQCTIHTASTQYEIKVYNRSGSLVNTMSVSGVLRATLPADIFTQPAQYNAGTKEYDYNYYAVIRTRNTRDLLNISYIENTVYLTVKPNPASVRMNAFEKSYLKTEGLKVTASWTSSNLLPTGFLYVRIVKDGVTVKEENLSASATSYSYTIPSFAGVRADYTFYVFTGNDASLTASDNGSFTVYNTGILQAADASGTRISGNLTLDNNGMISSMSSAQILSLARKIYLEKTVRVGSNVAWPAEDRFSWTSSDPSVAIVAAYSGTSWKSTQGGKISNSFPATTELKVVGFKNGRTTITLTHLETGMTESFTVDVVTLEGKLYIIQSLPGMSTQVVYTNGSGQEKRVSTDAAGRIAIYESSGITGDISLSTVYYNAKLLGGISSDELRSGEGSYLTSSVYPSATVSLKDPFNFYLTLYTYAGREIVVADFHVEMYIFKNGVMLPRAATDSFDATSAGGKIVPGLDISRLGTISSSDSVVFKFEITSKDGKYAPYFCEVKGKSVAGSVSVINTLLYLTAADAVGEYYNVSGFYYYGTDSTKELDITGASRIISINDTNKSGVYGLRYISKIPLTFDMYAAKADDATRPDLGKCVSGYMQVETIHYAGMNVYVYTITYTMNENTLVQGVKQKFFLAAYRGGVIYEYIPLGNPLCNMVGIEELNMDEDNMVFAGDMPTGNFDSNVAGAQGVNIELPDSLPIYFSMNFDDDPLNGTFSAVITLSSDMVSGDNFDFKAATKEIKNKLNDKDKKKDDNSGEVSWDVYGYLEGDVYYDIPSKGWKIRINEGGLGAHIGYGWEFSNTTILVFIPVYYGVEINIQVGVKLGFARMNDSVLQLMQLNGEALGYKNTEEFKRDYQTNFDCVFKFTVEAEVSVKAFGGIGFDIGILALKIGPYGKVTAGVENMTLTYANITLNSTHVSIGLEIGIEFEARFLCFSYETTLCDAGIRWHWYFGDNGLFLGDTDPNNRYYQETYTNTLLRGAMRMSTDDAGRVTQTTLMAESRDYLDDGQSWYTAKEENSGSTNIVKVSARSLAKLSYAGASFSAPSLSAGGETVIQTNAYPYSYPFVTEDGQVLFFLSDGASADLNDTQVYYSTLNSGSYTAPQKVDTNTTVAGTNTVPSGLTSDSNANMAGSGSFMVAAWVNMNDKVTLKAGDPVTEAEAAAALHQSEIQAAIRKNGGWTVYNITDNGLWDSAPLVAANGNCAVVVWQQLFESGSGTINYDCGNILMYSYYNGTSWSAPAVLDKGELGNVQSFDLAMSSGGKVFVLAAIDTDGDNGTLTDRAMCYYLLDGAGVSARTRINGSENACCTSPEVESVTLGGTEVFAVGYYMEHYLQYNYTDRDEQIQTATVTDLRDIKLGAYRTDGTVFTGFLSSVKEALNSDAGITENFKFVRSAAGDCLGISWIIAEDSGAVSDFANNIYAIGVADVLYVSRLTCTDGVYGLTSPTEVIRLSDGEMIDSFTAYITKTNATEYKYTAVYLKTSYYVTAERVASALEALARKLGTTVDKLDPEKNSLVVSPEKRSCLATVSATLSDKAYISSIKYESYSVKSGTELPFTITLFNDGSVKSASQTLYVYEGGTLIDTVNLNYAIKPNSGVTFTYMYTVPGVIKNLSFSTSVNFANGAQYSCRYDVELAVSDAEIRDVRLSRSGGCIRSFDIYLGNTSSVRLSDILNTAAGDRVVIRVYSDIECTVQVGEIKIGDAAQLQLMDDGNLCVGYDYTVTPEMFRDSDITLYFRVSLEDAIGNNISQSDYGNDSGSATVESPYLAYARQFTVRIKNDNALRSVGTSVSALVTNNYPEAESLVIVRGYLYNSSNELIEVRELYLAGGIGAEANENVTIGFTKSGAYAFADAYAADPLTSYNITYETYGGKILDAAYPTSYTHSETGTITLPVSLELDGYVFTGWYLDDSLALAAGAEVSRTTYGDLKFYARWVENDFKYTITSSGLTTGLTKEGGTYTLGTFTTVSGALAAIDGERRVLKDGKEVINEITVTFTNVTSDIILEGGRITVYGSISGMLTVRNAEVTSYADISSSGSEAVRVLAGGSFTQMGGNITSNSEYTITANAAADALVSLEGGSISGGTRANVFTWSPVNVGAGFTQKLSVMLYYHIEAAFNALGNTAITGSADVSRFTLYGFIINRPANSLVINDGGRILKAGANCLTVGYAVFNISYELGGGIISGEAVLYSYDKRVNLPTSASRDGYTFGGWYDNAALSGSSVTSVAPETVGDKTFWAKWILNAPAISGISLNVLKTYDGKTETLTVNASHALEFTYQWYKNNVKIDGQETKDIDVRDVTHSGSYYVILTVTDGIQTKTTQSSAVTVSIAKKDIADSVITPGGTLTYNSSVQTQEITGVEVGGLTVTYDVSGNTGKNVGTYTMTITGTGNFTGTKTKEFTISKTEITGITLTGYNGVYDKQEHKLAVSGLTTQYGDTLEVSYANNARTIVGTTTVTATLTNSNYNDLILNADIVITKATIEGITFPGCNVVYDSKEHKLTVSGLTTQYGDTLEVSYLNNARTVVGTTTVTATLTNSNYNDLILNANIVITKATIEGITFPGCNMVYDSQEHKLTVSGLTTQYGDTVEVAYANNARTIVGTTNVTATLTNSNYNDLILNADIVIIKATVTGITLPGCNVVYDSQEYKLAVSGLTTQYGDTVEVSYLNNARTIVGTTTVTATLTNSNYNDLVLTSDIVITKATIEGITLPGCNVVYDSQEHKLAVSGLMTQYGDTVEVSYLNNARTIVGTTTVTATLTNSNYNDLILNADIVITKATITNITLPGCNVVYDSQEHKLAVSGLTTQYGDTVEVTYLNNARTIVGTTTVTATLTNSNYNDLILNADIVITKATITGITLPGCNVVYDKQEHKLTVSGLTTQYGDTVEVSYLNNARTIVGTTTVTVTLTNSNYNDLILNADIVITKAAIEGITFPGCNVVYDSQEHKLTVSGLTTQYGDTVEVTYANNARTIVGTTTVTATLTNSNYNDLILNSDIVITKATITGITLPGCNVVYDSQEHKLAVSGLTTQYGDSVEVSYLNNVRSDVGTTTVTATLTNSNYNDLILNADIVITKATITGITFPGCNVVYDSQEHKLTVSGLTTQYGDTVEVTYENNGRTIVGTTTVTATLTNSNYNDLILNADIFITKATITNITFPGCNVVYDSQEHKLVVSGLATQYGDSVEVIYANNARTIVGTTTVTATLTNSNYYDLILNADIIITKATITNITLPGCNVVYDSKEYKLAVSGLTTQYGDTVEVTYANNARTIVGTTTVTATLTNSNYNDLVLTSDIVITKATVTGITLPGCNVVYDKQEHKLTVSGLTTQYGDTVEVSYLNNARTVVGTTTVTATLTNSNYFDLVLNSDIVITKAEIKGITFPGYIGTYDGTAHKIKVNTTLTQYGDQLLVSYTDNSRTDAGSSDATATLTNSNYFDLTLYAGITVNKALVTGVNLPGYSGSYDGTEHRLAVNKLTTQYGDIMDVVYMNNGRKDAGVTTVTAILTSKNYYDLVLNGNISISKAKLTFTADDKTSEYGDMLLTLTYTTSGTNYDGIIPTLTKEPGTGAGVYAINVTAENANYEITAKTGIYTITKRTLTVKAGSLTACVSGEAQSLHEYTASGLAAGDVISVSFTEGSVRTEPGTTVNTISDVTVKNGSNDVSANYQIIKVDGIIKLENHNFVNGYCSVCGNWDGVTVGGGNQPGNVQVETGEAGESMYVVDMTGDQNNGTGSALDITDVLDKAEKDNAGMRILFGNSASVTLDADAVKSISESGGKTEFSFKKINDDPGLASGDLGAAGIDLGRSDVYEISLDGATFNMGLATVTIPYNAKNGRDVYVCYVDADGNKIFMNPVYDEENHTVTFTTTHFSTYVIGVEKSFNWLWVLIPTVMLVGVAAVLVILIRKRRKA